MKRKVIIGYKKNGVLNQARLTIDRDSINLMEVVEGDNISFIYKDKEIKLKKSKIIAERSIFDKEKNLKEFIKNINFTQNFVSKEKNYYSYNLSIPLPVAKDMALDENPIVNILVNKKEMIIKTGGMMSKVYTIKNNKGGIGKSFTTVQLGAGLALMGHKTLLATSDSQNNILHYTLKKEELEKHDMNRGLRHAVLYGDNEDLYMEVRKNLYVIPTESSVFTETFEKKFEVWLEKKKEEYDYILIDSIPTMGIDKKFVECSDKIIIPTFCDYSTTEGILKVIEEAGAEKILAVLVNLYKNTKIQKEYYDKLKNILKSTGICFPEPIKELSQIETLLEKGKTIWESKSKLLEETQKSFLDVILNMVDK